MIFLEPLHLLLLFFPILLFVLSLKNTPKAPAQIFSESVLQRITLYSNRRKKNHNYRLFLFSIMFFIIALAHPILNSKQNKKSTIIPLVIALDISNSMSTNDIYQNRLSFAKKKLFLLLHEKSHLRLSLMLFSRNAYLAYPMSEDLNSFKYVVSNLDLQFQAGSNLFAVLQGAHHILQNYKSKNILLLSDGTSSTDFNEEKKYLLKNNIKLNVLYLSTNNSQKEKLKVLSHATNGAFSEYSLGDNDMKFLLSHIKQDAQKRNLTTKGLKTQKFTQLFYYPLFFALLILFFIFLKNRIFKKFNNLIFIFLYSVLTLSQIDLHANLLDFKALHNAKEFYENKEYNLAIKSYKKLPQTKQREYNIANSLYKKKAYKSAILMYKNALSNDKNMNASIYYNIANAYVYLQKFKSAKFYYIKSLKIKNDTMAQNNLDELLLFIKHKKISTKNKPKLPKSMSSSVREIPEPVSSNFIVQLKNTVLTQEEKWMRLIQKEKPTIFLQKLHTTRMSENANNDD